MAKLNQGIFGDTPEKNAFAGNLATASAGKSDPTREASPVTVVIGGQITPPRFYTVQRFTRSLGGRHVDQAVITAERNRGSLQLYVQDGPLRPEEHGKQLSIFYGANRVFWGVVEDASYAFGEEADTKTIVATIQPWHFGPPVAAAQYLHIYRDEDGRTERSVVMASEPIVFNGFVDPNREMKGKEGLGYFVGNCAHLGRFKAKKRDGNDTSYEANMLVPLEVLQTSAGQSRYVDEWRAFDERSRWTLRTAVRYLCAIGNYETLIANPSDKDIDVLPDITLPRTEMPVGAMLPQMLDMLLAPYGCDWYVDVGDGPATGGNAITQAVGVFNAAVSGTGKPRIRFVEYGKGIECTAKYGKVGAAADYSSTNVIDAGLSYSTAPTINEVHCMGGPFTVEGTFELYRVADNKWAANEAGDYERDVYGVEIPVIDLTDAFPDSLLGNMAGGPFVSRLQRRRRLHPTITVSNTITGDTQPKGPHNGFLIEVIDLGQEDVPEAEKEWVPIDRITDAMFRHVRVLEDECAIVFDPGEPEEGDETAAVNFYIDQALGDNARMRITGSFEADFVMQKIVTRNGRSPSVSAASRAFVWHDPKRWPCRRIINTGTLASQYADAESTNKTPTADEVLADMDQAAKQILERTDAAQVSGALTFFGLHHYVPLGSVVKVLAGRGVTMGTRYESDSASTSSETDNPQFPQIVSVEWSPQSAEILAALNIEPGEGLEAIQ